MKQFLAIIALFGAFSIFCFTGSAKGSVTIPILADVNSLIITEIEIDGEKFKFLIDTGAGANFISPDFAAKFDGKILKRKSDQDQNIANATEKVGSKAYEIDLKVGSLDFGTMLAFEQKTNRFNEKQDGIDCCSGILGIEFLKKYPVLIDRIAKKITLNASQGTEEDTWVKLPVELPNEHTIVLKCQSSLGPTVEFRLDSGSEVPLVLQKRFIDKYALIDRFKVASKAKPKAGFPIISFGEIKCSEKMPAIRIDALAYTGASGALTHSFVDGNLGAVFLGNLYLLDLDDKAIYLNKASLQKDVRLLKDMGEGLVIDLSLPKLEEYFQHLRFDPIQERIKSGLDGLSKRETFSVGELLLSSASKENEKLGFSLLEAVSNSDVPCIQYYQAESLFRKDRFEDALKKIKEFQKTEEKTCEGNGSSLFNCCPASKYRNAKGLKKLLETLSAKNPQQDIAIKLPLAPMAKNLKTPLVVWEGKTFLLDTGSEHHIWNTACAADLGLQLDKETQYGGSDSIGQTAVANFAQPRLKVLGLPPENLAGFAMNLSEAAKSYKGVKKFCGILSPQRIIPKGLLVLDWASGNILVCQGETCRKSLDLPTNCPMYMFNGRPYFNLKVNSEEAKLFLVDSGANLTSANLNYFTNKPELQKSSSPVAAVTGTSADSSVIAKSQVNFCGMSFNVNPFPVRPEIQNWEWSENGKIGMNLLFDSMLVLDFGKGMALVK